MKLARQGLLFAFTCSLSVLYILTIDIPHQLKFVTDIQIIPLENHSYNGCIELAIKLDSFSLWQTRYGSGDCKWMP